MSRLFDVLNTLLGPTDKASEALTQLANQTQEPETCEQLRIYLSTGGEVRAPLIDAPLAVALAEVTGGSAKAILDAQTDDALEAIGAPVKKPRKPRAKGVAAKAKAAPYAGLSRGSAVGLPSRGSVGLNALRASLNGDHS